MPVLLARDAAARWRALGGKLTPDTFAGLGHGIDGRSVQQLARHLGWAVP